MKLERKIIETIDLKNSVKIKDVKINKKNYDVEIQNNGDVVNLIFRENGRGPYFSINIEGKGLSFERYALRPGHDHDDIETLQEMDEEGKGAKVFWEARFPYDGERRKLFRIPFGSVVKKY